jgi:SNF2 family DNA or RNA helicase
MPLHIELQDNKIVARFRGRSYNFTALIQILKNFKCTYDPETKDWEVPPKQLEPLLTVLEDVEVIQVENEVHTHAVIHGNPPSEQRKYRSLLNRIDLKVPPFKGRTPYEDYQYEDVMYLTTRNRFALFNEQGTGKSYELISALDYYRRENMVHKVLVITSNSGVYNMKKEFEKFSGFDPSRLAIAGVNNREPFHPDVDVVVCNYRSFLLISDHAYLQEHPDKKPTKKSEREDGEKSKLSYRKCPLPLQQWIGEGSAALILDESHYIANSKARQTKAIMMSAPYFDYRYLASGTPADKEEKFYTQLKILDPSLVHNMTYSEWLEEYAVVGTRWSPWALDHFKPEKLPDLQKIVSDNCVRRFSGQVLDLPENFIYPIYVPFTDLQKDIYHKCVKEKIYRIQEEEGAVTARSIANSFQHLILAIDNPKLLLKHEDKLKNPQLISLIESFDFQKDHSKVEAVKELIELHPDSKIIVWNSHPSVSAELAILLKEYNPLVINGESVIPKGMSMEQFKDSIVKKFQTDVKHRVLIAGLQVLNTAVTIVEANIQIVFDCNFNFVEYSQALKRIDRIGQTKQVRTYVIVVDESLDVVRKLNIEGKDDLNRNFLTTQYVTQDQLVGVFNMKGS